MRAPTETDAVATGSRSAALRTLFGGVALGTTGYFIAATASSLLAEDITGSAAWSGIPSAAGVLGTAAGALVVTAATARLQRRGGLVLGYAIGMAGGLTVVIAAARSSFALMLLGMLMIGVGHSTNQLTRYAAADLSEDHRRGSAISWIVWASTLGAVAGPNLLAPAGRAATLIGLPVLAGGYVVVAVFFLAPIVLYQARLRIAPDADAPRPDAAGPASVLSNLVRMPRVRVAAVAMILGQAVMVLIMTMTPLHLRGAGHGLDTVGLVIGAHTLGMFGLAPLAGRLADRAGSVPVILGGLGLLALAAVTAATATPSHTPSMAAALFVLGLGWSFGLIAGSNLLTRGLVRPDAVQLQGATETAIWSASAVASLSSGVLLAIGSYAVLCVVGLLLAGIATTVVVTHRHALRGAGSVSHAAAAASAGPVSD